MDAGNKWFTFLVNLVVNGRSTPARMLVVVGTILKPCETPTGLQNSALM